jgi:hypothetical protein
MGSQVLFRYGAVKAPTLPSHAYHPNASLRLAKRAGYIAWPAEGKTTDRKPLS